MKPLLVLSDADRIELTKALGTVEANPYRDYPEFKRQVAQVSAAGIPESVRQACEQIRRERAEGTAEGHVLRNCPVDDEIPFLDNEDPSGDKRALKTTFVAEGWLELFGQLCQTPLLSYATRFGGDFFIDVVAINRYKGQQTGYSDGEVVFHNDRTAHPVRADYITLLGMRCPPGELIYTGFVSGRQLLEQLDEATQHTLRQPYFMTPFDVVSRDADSSLDRSPAHPILSGNYSIRYLDTHTTVDVDAPAEAKDALLALKNALARSVKSRHRLLDGDMLTFANQEGLHNREHIEITDPDTALQRWLLKTYAFRDQAAADRHADRWIDGIPGKVGD
jgi:L-asparagine oxygenase